MTPGSDNTGQQDRISNSAATLALVPEAESLGAFRIVNDDVGRYYHSPWAGPKWIGHLFRQARATGAVVAHSEPDTSYAVLDVYDADGSVIQDFTIPTRQAFKWWYRKLELRVVRYDD